MSSLEAKEKLSLLSLPDELLFSCLARISRLYYPTLSIVSKRFRSLIASPELYNARSLLDQTEICFYVCVRFRVPDGYRWFTLSRKPDSQTNDSKKSTKYFLTAIPAPMSPLGERSDLVAVGSKIYNISRSSTVSILDCRSHTWREAPSVGEKMLTSYCARVVDQKIYIAGCCKDGESYSKKNLVQVFDTKTESFDPVPITSREIQGNFFLCCACIDGKFHVMKGGKLVAYNSKEGRWDSVEAVGKYSYVSSYFEIEDVLYYFHDGKFLWYDSKGNMWREMKGLVDRLPKLSSYSCVKLLDYGGKMVIFWEDDARVASVKERMIWCAEITLERRENCEMWGKVEWLDCVFTMPKYYEVEKVLAVTV